MTPETKDQGNVVEAFPGELKMLRKQVADAAREINCAGPIAHRIRILKSEHAASLAEKDKRVEAQAAEIESLKRVVIANQTAAQNLVSELQEKQNEHNAALTEHINTIHELESTLAASRGEWRPIADAPRDGTPILLLWKDGGIAKARWKDVDYNESTDQSGYDWVFTGRLYGEYEEQPIGWQPLPPPPTGEVK